MLTVLIGLPAVWVYFGPLPPAAQQAVDHFVQSVKETLGQAAPEIAVEQTPVAPKYQAPHDTVPARPEAEALLADISRGERSKPLEPLLKKLRDRGVLEYRLEHWGSGWYRFRCDMPLSTDVQHARQFEAIAENPLATVQQVVGEVLAWHPNSSATTHQ